MWSCAFPCGCLACIASQSEVASTKCVMNQIAGLPTNIGFLKALVGHPAFAAGDVDTHFIDRFKADLLPLSQDSTSKQKINVPQETRYGAALAAAAFGIKSTSES